MNTPLFVRFVNNELSLIDLINIYIVSEEESIKKSAESALKSYHDISEFKEEFTDAVRDLITYGISDAFIAFVNNYMQDSLEEDIVFLHNKDGNEGYYRSAKVKNINSTWIEALLCYNLCLYIKAYGLEELKICKVCNKFFCNKGKYAVYCSDTCKKIHKS